MKTRFTLGIVVVLLLLIAAAVALWWQYQPEELEHIANIQPANCLFSDTITGSTAVPNWTTAAQLESREVDRKKLTPFEPLQELTLDEQPLAWLTPNGTVVVDNEVFSDLKFVDVSGFTGDLAPTVIGQLTETDLTDPEWRTVLEFLLQSHVIKTYAHLEAELCLKEEANTQTEYSARFSAVHRYCTNDCYEVPYEFTVNVDKQTKNISVL